MSMLRSLRFGAAAAVIASLGLAACGSDSLSPGGSTPTESGSAPAPVTADPALVAKLPAKIKSAGVIVIGTDPTYAPNEFLDTDGQTVIGMDVDLFDAVAAKFGIKTKWVPAGFGSIILGTNSGKFDIGVSSFTINKERMQQATMVSYFNAGTLWVTKKGNPNKVDPDNACGLNIGAQKDTVQVDDLKARSKKCTDAGKPPINIIIDADQGKVTASVLSGKTLAMLADSPIGYYAVQQSNGQFESLGEIYDAAPYGFVLPKSAEDFGQAIADALKALDASGDYTKILTKWGNEKGAISDFQVNPPVGG